MTGTEGRTLSIAPTWSVIWESCVSSASIEPDRLLTIFSPNRTLQVLSGNVHVLVEVLGGQAAADARRALPLLGDADDRVVVGAELDRLADRILVGEQGLGGGRGEDGVVLILLVVGGGEEPAAVHLQHVELGVVLGRADHAAVQIILVAAGSACGSRGSAAPS